MGLILFSVSRSRKNDSFPTNKQFSSSVDSVDRSKTTSRRPSFWGLKLTTMFLSFKTTYIDVSEVQVELSPQSHWLQWSWWENTTK